VSAALFLAILPLNNYPGWREKKHSPALNKTIKKPFLTLLALCALTSIGRPADDLAKSFAALPPSARPWVCWFWINGNISKEGITADLEAMQRVGIDVH
jgi:hypothetical protein